MDSCNRRRTFLIFKIAVRLPARPSERVQHDTMVLLASGMTISRLASDTPRLVVLGQWGGAGGAICEELINRR